MRRITTASGSRTRPVRKAPPRLKRFTDSIFTDLAKQTRYMEPALAARWQEIVGPELASVCWPGRLKTHLQEGTLEIIARDGSAATKLQYQTNQIIKGVEKFLGPGRVRRIAIRQQQKSIAKQRSKEHLNPQTAAPQEPNERSSLSDILAKYQASLNKK